MWKKALIAKLSALQIPWEEQVPLSAMTSFQIGGPAALVAKPTSADTLVQLLQLVREGEIPYFLLGKGSNVLASDRGYPGVVIQTGGLQAMSLDGADAITCECGVSLSRLCLFALEHGLSGLEFAYGIPGSVGGAIAMNAGAYGGECKDVLTHCEWVDADGVRRLTEVNELSLSYRHSIFSDTPGCALSARFQLIPDDPAAIRARMDDYMNRRREKQPLQYPSCGSTFKRPVQGYASALIDTCGLKGLQVGGAQVSTKHAGFIVNLGGATAEDVRTLMSRVTDAVLLKTGITLEPEVKLLGFEEEET